MYVEVRIPSNSKIMAIKTYRFLTDKGLKDSKDYIETLPVDVFYTFEADTSRTAAEIQQYISDNRSDDVLIREKIVTPAAPLNISFEISGNSAKVNIKGANITAEMTIPKGNVPDMFHWAWNNFSA